MKSIMVLAVVPAVLGSVSIARADDGYSYFALSASAGGIVMDLPDAGGSFEGAGIDDQNDLLLGGTLGLSAAAGLGEINGLAAYIGLTGFVSYAAGDFDKTHSFTGPGVVIIQGGAGPNLGSIEISTSSGGVGGNGAAVVGLSVSNTNPQAGNLVASAPASSTNPGGGAQDVAFVEPEGESFLWGGSQTEATDGTYRSAAYAAIADTNGGVFIAAGDLTGLSITTQYRTEVLYAGGDLTFGLSGARDSNMVLQGYAGPSYRYLAQRNSTSSEIVVDVPEFVEDSVEFPIFGMQSTEELTAHYMGGVIGASVTMPVTDNSALTLGGELGGYYTLAALESSGTYMVEGGSIGDPNPAPYPLQIVEAEGDGEDGETFALAARGTAVYTVAMGNNMQVSFAGTVDYLSRVAQPGVNATVTGYDGTDDGTVSYVSGGDSDGISWGDMIAFGGSVSLTGQF